MLKKVGNQTIKFNNPPVIIGASSAVGKKEGEGPLKEYFDIISKDPYFGKDTWEKAESEFVYKNVENLLKKCNLKPENIDYAFSGDLLNQCCASTFGFKDFKIPFFGLFGACSTFGEALSLGAMAIDGDFAEKVICSAGSHFCSAEKQFRFPVGLGNQRPQSATWTVTGNGGVVLSKEGIGPKITYVTTGKIIDMGIKDSSNMGGAMAPAAAHVIYNHLKDTGRSVDYYSVIATGDLGYGGRAILRKLLKDENVIVDDNLKDCGIEIFNRETQDTHSGGSGCACSAVTYSGYFHKLLEKGEIKSILLVPTGALMSTTSSQQGEAIPAIAHAVAIEKI